MRLDAGLGEKRSGVSGPRVGGDVSPSPCMGRGTSPHLPARGGGRLPISRAGLRVVKRLSTSLHGASQKVVLPGERDPGCWGTPLFVRQPLGGVPRLGTEPGGVDQPRALCGNQECGVPGGVLLLFQSLPGPAVPPEKRAPGEVAPGRDRERGRRRTALAPEKAAGGSSRRWGGGWPSSRSLLGGCGGLCRPGRSLPPRPCLSRASQVTAGQGRRARPAPFGPRKGAEQCETPRWPLGGWERQVTRRAAGRSRTGQSVPQVQRGPHWPPQGGREGWRRGQSPSLCREDGGPVGRGARPVAAAGTRRSW